MGNTDALKLWQGGCGAAEDRTVNGVQYPTVSVVLGDVIDIGESSDIDIPFERVS
jgi:hypothetical protein